MGISVSQVKDKLEMMEPSFNRPDVSRDAFMLKGMLAKEGYDVWRYLFTGQEKNTEKEKVFFLDFFALSPEAEGEKPSHMMVSAGAFGVDGSVLHHFYEWKDVIIKEDLPLLVSAGECFMSETRTIGRVDVSEEDPFKGYGSEVVLSDDDLPF